MAFKVVTGPPCSGKSTFVATHMKEHDVVFDYDRVSGAITHNTEHTSDARSYAHRFVLNMRSAYVRTAKDNNHSADDVWLIMTNLTESFRDYLKDLNPEYIPMDISEEECLKRLEKDDSRPDKKKWKEIIHQWFATQQEERCMTPKHKTKFKNAAQIRAMSVSVPEQGQRRIDTDYYVEGYATTYEPYILFYDQNNEPVYERFERGCFDQCDMSDIIMQYDHAGKVLARNTNGSLIVEPDDRGLFNAADLGRTEAARSIYEDIKAGMVTKMSWRFLPGEYYYDTASRTIVHETVRKIYDVAPVSLPANNQSEINARSWADGVIDLAARSEAELEVRRRRLRIRNSIKIGGNIHE